MKYDPGPCATRWTGFVVGECCWRDLVANDVNPPPTPVDGQRLGDERMTKDSADATMTRHSGPRAGATLDPLALHARVLHAEGAPLRDVQAAPLATFGPGAEREIVVGRLPGGGPGERTWALPFDATMSRRHARLKLVALGNENAVVVEDLGSHNGTYVDGVRLTAPMAVWPGQVLRVAGTTLVIGAMPRARAARLRETTPPPQAYVALSWASLETWERVARVAASDAGILLLGGIGTGKTRLARHLHDHSGRGGPFVSYNCSAIPLNLEEATLFGVADGFIPSIRKRDGWVTRARGGTLFLDELAEMPQVAQAKLLDAFDPTDPSYVPVGGTSRLRTDCRLVSATNRDVFALAAAGVVRQDLLSRIVVAQVTVPPLTDRQEDVVELLDRALVRHGSSVDAALLTAEHIQALLQARWAENVRGLESLAARIALGETLTPDAMLAHAERGLETAEAPAPAAVARPEDAPPTPRRRPIWPPEPEDLLHLLRDHDFNVAAAAAALGRRRETLSRLTSTTFGQGGATAARRAWRIYEATGRVPEPSELVDDEP